MRLFFKSLAIALILMAGVQTNYAMNGETKTEKATLGGGCFWCMEAIYHDVQR